MLDAREQKLEGRILDFMSGVPYTGGWMTSLQRLTDKLAKQINFTLRNTNNAVEEEKKEENGAGA